MFDIDIGGRHLAADRGIEADADDAPPAEQFEGQGAEGEQISRALDRRADDAFRWAVRAPHRDDPNPL
jgi:hypothetical protein